MVESVAVVIDPFHPYAAKFIDVCYTLWGTRSICVYTDRARRRSSAGQFAVLRGPAVAASYYSGLDDMHGMAAAIGSRHKVVGVIPHDEALVVPAAELAGALGLDWVPSAVMSLFRDKHSLKEVLRHHPSAPRVNATAMVSSVREIRDAIASGTYERFVLKPNDGVGNSRIGFFTDRTPDEALKDYLRATAGGPVVMEEFLDGPEYCVNGQVDDAGVTTLSVFRTHHVSANGRPQLAASFELVPQDSPIFQSLADYAGQVLTAAGLSRSPFHMEVIVDSGGPCLVEVGARMAGAGMGFSTAVAHGGSLDPFALAAKAYLGRADHLPDRPDWVTYNARALRTVCGISDAEERITRMEGVDRVESLPEFVSWVFKPRVGQQRHLTVDLATSPWQVTLAGSSDGALVEAETRVRRLLRPNPNRSPLTRRFDEAWTKAVRAGRRVPGVPELVKVRPVTLPVSTSRA